MGWQSSGKNCGSVDWVVKMIKRLRYNEKDIFSFILFFGEVFA